MSNVNQKRPTTPDAQPTDDDDTTPRLLTAAPGSAIARSVTRLNAATTTRASTATGPGRRGTRGERHRWAS